MKKYVLFGAGYFGEVGINLLGVENIAYILDNDSLKDGNTLHGIPIIDYKKYKKDEFVIVITVSETYEKEICNQLERDGIKNYKSIHEIQYEQTKKRIEERYDCINVYKKSINWIKNNTMEKKGICCSSVIRKAYPEVTGYYIPTLLRWGYRDLASSYAKWLCSIQKEDGSWYDTYDEDPYIFDTAQILKGLLSIRNSYCNKIEINNAIIKGCNWILNHMSDDGQLITPSKAAWGEKANELIHTYCISPLMEASKVYCNTKYEKAAIKILGYYKKNFYNEIVNFNMLSHFYAYVVEAMVDIGENELARIAMNNVAKFQKKSGAVPAYNNVDWVCSTGLFQFALVWFKLGDIERGEIAFNYACKLQNESGGWYGSYVSEDNKNDIPNYFPNEEISWAVKYFLDALYYKNLMQFERQASRFESKIQLRDGRYSVIEDIIRKQGSDKDILDVGCGKGRYLRNLINRLPSNKYYAIDLSKKVMEFIADLDIEKKQGTLTNIPYADCRFDVVYVCEALEHAIDIQNAIRELCRVTKKNGFIIIIDKNVEKLGCLEIEDCEQWFDEKDLKGELYKYCSEVYIKKNIVTDKSNDSGLFYCWVGKKCIENTYKM